MNSLRSGRQELPAGTIAAGLFLLFSLALSITIVWRALQPAPAVVAQTTAVSTVSPQPSPPWLSPSPTPTVEAAIVPPIDDGKLKIGLVGDSDSADALQGAIESAAAQSPVRESLQVQVLIASRETPQPYAGIDLLVRLEPGEDGLTLLNVSTLSLPQVLQVEEMLMPWDVAAPETLPLLDTDFAFSAQYIMAIAELEAGYPEAIPQRIEVLRLIPSSTPAEYAGTQQALIQFLQARLDAPQNPAKALRGYSQLLRTEPDFTAAQINRGNVYLRLGDADSALINYEAALEQQPDRVEVLYNRVLAYEQQGDLESALIEALQIARLNPETAWAINLVGLMQYRQGSYNDAIRSFTSASRFAPTAPAPIFNTAMAHYHQGDYEAAIDTYLMLMAIAPRVPAYYVRLGLAYEAADKPHSAEDAYNRARVLDSQYLDVYLLRGGVRLRLNKIDDALEDAKRVIALEPEDGRGYALLGDVMLAQEEWRAATDTYSQAIDLGLETADVYAGRGWGWQRQRYAPYAVRDYQKAIALGNGDVMLLYHLGFALFDTGQFEDSVDVLLSAINGGIDSAEAHAILSVALDATHRDEDADTAYQRALQLDSSFGDATFLAQQPLWSRAAIRRAEIILQRLDQTR
jgi:tetratricopeptide (TPR) repeat protein